ncbi:P1 family peptidase [Planktotalea frisia]|jgi:L-aminopeptidase/D-esterase-like protein|uniref:P1 family peptidase n=1 Tax=Planktotalea frisia TaxID=696762 RepID=UPI0023561A8E|nr:P1 family peptidase [Planktotalea frisia]
MKPGPLNLITDVQGLKVGHAQDESLKSGTTVLTSDKPLVSSVHVMGGAPGSRETDLLDPDKSAPGVDAFVLSGGSAFGLDAASGVVQGLRDMGRGFQVHTVRVPIVPAAIIFDLINGGNKHWDASPYPALGEAALSSADAIFTLGSVGAGTGAMSAMLKGGTGSASLTLDSGVTVGALMIANPIGSVTTPGERHFWAAPFEIDAEFGGQGVDPSTGLGRDLNSEKITAMLKYANTTIGIVATDAKLSKAQCKRVAIAAHDGIGRACVPAHTPMDGDLIFSTTTGEKELSNPDFELAMIGHAAALCVTRAIARAVYEASPAKGDLLPTWREKNEA